MLRESIKKHEGLRLKPYKCLAGKWTLWYGHNLEDNPLPNDLLIKIAKVGFHSLEAAELVLTYDIKAAKMYLHGIFGSDVITSFPIEVQAVFTEMVFQMGPASFMGFRKMLKAAHKKDWKTVYTEMLDSKWAREDTPKRARELSNAIKKLSE